MMQTVSRTSFTTIKTEGALLPPDLLQRIVDGNDLNGLRPEDYHLEPRERLNEVISRSWSRCQAAWSRFDRLRAELAEDDTGTTLTRERWLLTLFNELGYGRLQTAGRQEIEGTSYPISHIWGRVPIHLVTFRQDLDRRSTVATAVRRSPHSLMQEFLNRSDDHLWGFISNGLRLRILRDNVSLTRAAYAEFDLETMMRGEGYADFALLWMLCQRSRVEGDDPNTFWLERWSRVAAERGTRALDSLRDGVQKTIVALGQGFLGRRYGTPLNVELIAKLRSGELTTQDYYRQLLRMVYRLIFLFVAEDRDLLLVPDADIAARERYTRYYSAQRLRELAGSLRGSAHGNLYKGLSLVFHLLHEGYAPLGLPALGSYLFGPEATPDLDDAELSNGDLLGAIRELAFTTQNSVRRPVDYRNLGSEELGSVYESLLELHPQVNVDAGAFALVVVSGSERKTTGSYYTPSSLIQSLLDSALEPVVEDRLQEAEASIKRQNHASRVTQDALRLSLEESLLSIKIVDPACGSGHFLIGAAHRLARHLARIRTGEEEPGPEDLRIALRDVVRRCIHGVDINPMAVELCKVALWMETLDPGKPLSFLDANIQCGNSLLGATPALLEQGIPDDAFKPITGDDKAYCREWRKRNRQEREDWETKQAELFDVYEMRPWERLGDLATSMMDLTTLEEDTLDDVRAKGELYEELVRSSGYEYGRLLADAWCAAFMWKKTDAFDYPITEGVFRRIERNPFDLAPWMRHEIERLRDQYRFFHWHLAFPQAFRLPGKDEEAENEGMGWSGGFDVVLGNPPWEQVNLMEKEFFAGKDAEIAGAPNAAARKQLIRALQERNSDLWTEYRAALRDAEATSLFAGASSRYPLTARGRVNTYQLFAGLARHLIAPEGRAGIVVPTGIATDYTNRDYFADLVSTGQLASLYDFENRRGIFPGVHRSYKFSLLTLRGTLERTQRTAAAFAFFLLELDDLADEQRRFELTAADFALLNPNTRTCPIFRTRRDAELTRKLYRAAPVLVNEQTGQNPWDVSFKQGLFNMASDSHLFRTREQLEAQGFALQGNRFVRGEEAYLPLYEAKMFHQFDHRFGSYRPAQTRAAAKVISPTAAQYANPGHMAQPWYWVKQQDVEERWAKERTWTLAFRNVARATDECTGIFSVLPRAAIGHSAPILAAGNPHVSVACCLFSNLDTFAFDFVLRQKTGGINLTFFIVKQLPVLPPERYTPGLLAYIVPRVLELTCTAWDLASFADDVWREADGALRAVIEAQWQANVTETGGHVGAHPPEWLESPPSKGLGPLEGQERGFPHPLFKWADARRARLRAELDGLYAHLYGLTREELDYIMETFPIVKRKDEAKWGEYRTKRMVLEAWEELETREW